MEQVQKVNLYRYYNDVGDGNKFYYNDCIYGP